MTVIAALVLTFCMAARQAPDTRAEAERLAAAGANEEALKRFQALAAANPDDTAARLWIGRLHLRMGHARRAAGVFESLVATDPGNVDALAGLGRALVDAGDLVRGGEALDRAEALAADRLDVLAAQGRRHGASGHATLALAYYGRALAAEPGNADIRAAADALRAARAHRLALGYNIQRFDPSAPQVNSGMIEVNARLNDALRVVATGEMLRVDGSDEGRGGAGIEWLVRPTVLVRSTVIGGGERWLPGLDAAAEIAYRRARARWTLTARYFEFDGAELWIAGPGLAYDVTPRLTLVAQYLRGSTSVGLASDTTSDNAVLGVHGRPSDRLTAFIEYRHGIDRLDWLTADRVLATDAQTLGLGGSLALTPFVNVGAGYDYQDRSAGLAVHRGRALLTFRF